MRWLTCLHQRSHGQVSCICANGVWLDDNDNLDVSVGTDGGIASGDGAAPAGHFERDGTRELKLGPRESLGDYLHLQGHLVSPHERQCERLAEGRHSRTHKE